MIELVRDLAKVQAGTSDYLSYETALYLHGFIATLPEQITFVTTGRRRPRISAGHRIEFVFHKEDKPREYLKIEYLGQTLLVATLAQALLDIVSDKNHIALETIARWFWEIPYNVSEVVALSEKTGNTALKRILFWCLWSGRLNYCDLPKGLKRIPALLIKNDSDIQLWEGAIQVFYPRRLLEFQPCVDFIEASFENSDWMRLRTSPAFIDFSFAEQWLPIAGDQRKNSNSMLEKYFRIELDRLIKENLSELLIGLSGIDQAGSSGRFSRKFLQWVVCSAEFPDCAIKDIRKWSDFALKSDNALFWEIAFVYAPATGLIDEAFEKIRSSAGKIFNSGHCKGIEALYRFAEKHNHLIPIEVIFLLARILARSLRFEEAMAELNKLRKKGRLSPFESLDLEFNTGVIYRESGKLGFALEHFARARQLSEKQGRTDRISAIASAEGNIHFVSGSLASARISYLKAFSMCKSNGNPFQIANLKTNLGMVEFKSGRLKKAEKFFLDAIQQQSLVGNLQGELASLISLAKVRQATGKISSSIELLNVALQKLDQKEPDADKRELYALLAWSNELSGLSEKSLHYWQMALSDEGPLLLPSARFLIRFYHALHTFLMGDFVGAKALLRALTEFAEKNGITGDEIAFSLFYEAMAMHQQNDSSCVKLMKESLAILANRKEHPFFLLANSYAGLAFPGLFPETNLEQALDALLASSYYEPLWLFFAEKLFLHNSNASSKLLKSYWERSSEEFRTNLQSRFPGFRKTLKKLGEKGKGIGCLTLIKNSQERSIELMELETWDQHKPANCFVFNSLTGRLSFSHRQGIIKSGSLSNKILIKLFQAFPRSIEISTLYEVVWGGKYDPDCDWPAIKTALTRLRRSLQAVSSAIKIKATGKNGLVILSVKSSWEVVFL